MLLLLLLSLSALLLCEMTEELDVPRFPQYAPDVAESKEEKGEGESRDTSATATGKRHPTTSSHSLTRSPHPSLPSSLPPSVLVASAAWQYALTELDLLPESDALLLWLTRFAVEKNHPRPLTGRVQAYVAGGEVLTIAQDEKLPQAFKVHHSLNRMHRVLSLAAH